MKIAYVVMAYKNPGQLLRLTNALQSGNSAFFVHIDKSSDISGFVKAFSKSSNNIHFVERENSWWGSIGLVKAALNAIRSVLLSNEKYDYLYFMSGQDYPIKSVSYIERFISENRDKVFMQCMKLPDGCWGGNGGMDRIKYYHYHNFRNRRTIKLVNRCLKSMHVFLPERKSPGYIKKYYGGEFFFGFNLAVAGSVRAFVDGHTDYLSFHKHTYCPEEMFFQTLLMNSGNNEIISSVIKKTLTYVDWNRPEPRPAILGIDDYAALSGSDKLFARKFDSGCDSVILDMIDERILKNA